jgi:hypothetical protein
MWPFKDVYGMVAPFRSTLGLVATNFSYNSKLSADIELAALRIDDVLSYPQSTTFIVPPRNHCIKLLGWR